MGSPDEAWAAFRAEPVDPVTRRFWQVSADIIRNRVKESTSFGDRVLDVGCGNGGMTLAICRTGRQCVGIDTSTDAVAAARSAAKAVGIDTIFFEAPAERTPFDDRSFDAVLLASVLQHVDDQRSALAEARRVLKPNGRLVVSVPQTLRPSTRKKPGLYTLHFTLASLRKILADTGFAVTRLEPSGLLMPVTTPVLLHLNRVVDATVLFDELERVVQAVPQLASNLVVTAKVVR